MYFASAHAQLNLGQYLFVLNETITLCANSNGIKSTKQKVTLKIGTFSATIPAVSFFKTPDGKFVFVRVVDKGTLLLAQIMPLGNNMFTFQATGVGLDLTGLTDTVALTIGIDYRYHYR